MEEIIRINSKDRQGAVTTSVESEGEFRAKWWTAEDAANLADRPLPAVIEAFNTMWGSDRFVASVVDFSNLGKSGFKYVDHGQASWNKFVAEGGVSLNGV